MHKSQFLCSNSVLHFIHSNICDHKKMQTNKRAKKTKTKSKCLDSALSDIFFEIAIHWTRVQHRQHTPCCVFLLLFCELIMLLVIRSAQIEKHAKRYASKVDRYVAAMLQTGLQAKQKMRCN